jgi:hypothetical protein
LRNRIRLIDRHHFSRPRPEGRRIRIGVRPTEQKAIAGLDPDLIVCTDIPGREYQPIDQLIGIAPTLPVTKR